MAGGITLYRTFALYEEKKEFNVLRGRIPAFGEYDINILAITVDGEKANTIPEPNNYIVNVDCQNGSGYWDYDNWNAVITEINTQTKCNLHFETSTESNIWRTWIQKGEVTKYYTTLHNFLSDTEAVTQVFNSVEASTYLKENTSIVESIKEDANYLPNALPEVGENEDSRSELVKIILNSTGLTNQEKYTINLPFYIFKDGNSFLTFKNLRYTAYGSSTYDSKYGTSIYLSLTTIPTRCGYNIYRSDENIDTSNYKMASIRYNVKEPYYFRLGFTSKTSTTDLVPETVIINPSVYNNIGWYSTNISDVNVNKFVGFGLGMCTSNENSVQSTVTLYEWYMY